MPRTAATPIAAGAANALPVPWNANTRGWGVAIASGAAFAIQVAALLLFFRGYRPLSH